MDETRTPNQALLYTLRGRRSIGSPRKRWKAETGRGRFPKP
jgi:hypothetical protein